ncbi:hypothetical protein [Paenibacillus sp. LPE1-1-1.1]|uniref:hypothetical protein n=1 Tax=Paenibacillus sp. LPE1-1-1.1 TaxID=3135230 RepID=UPI0034413AA8
MKGVQHVFDNEDETVRCIQALTNDAGADAVMLCVGRTAAGLPIKRCSGYKNAVQNSSCNAIIIVDSSRSKICLGARHQ